MVTTPGLVMPGSVLPCVLGMLPCSQEHRMRRRCAGAMPIVTPVLWAMALHTGRQVWEPCTMVTLMSSSHAAFHVWQKEDLLVDTELNRHHQVHKSGSTLLICLGGGGS